MQERNRKIVSILLGAFAGVFVLTALNLGAWYSTQYWRMYSDMSVWRTAPGELETLEVRGGYSVARSSGGMHYDVYCTYKYNVGGRTYEGIHYRHPSSSYGDPDLVLTAIKDDLHLQNPVWRTEGSGITFSSTLADAKGTAVQVLYYPPDPAEAMLVNGGDNGAGRAGMIFFFIFAFLVDAAALLMACVWAGDRRNDHARKREEAARPKIPVPVDLCDCFIPLLDEGIAAAQLLGAAAKPDFKMDMDRLAQEFQDLRQKAAGRHLFMDQYPLSLGRRFEWEPADGNREEIRFKKAIYRIDDFYSAHLVLR